MKSLTVHVDPCQLSTAVFVLKTKIEDIERQRRVRPDDVITVEQAQIRSTYLAQLQNCFAILSAPLDAWRANPS